jgi:hypothetical protein
MKPQFIYKYESFSIQSLHNLKSQVIYFGSPKDFNDPFDCALSHTVDHATDAEVETVRTHLLGKPDMPPAIRARFEKITVEELRTMATRTTEEKVKEFAKEFLETKGVTCFSESHDNLLMWSHYADKSRGFCLEFDTSFEPFTKMMPVSYSKVIPAVKLTDVHSGELGTRLLEKLYCTKSADWAYEREWRSIHNKRGTEFRYKTVALRGVYFGPETTFASKEIVCLILQGQNPDVKFYHGERSQTEFKVSFTPFSYTPHLEAKRRGLVP